MCSEFCHNGDLYHAMGDDRLADDLSWYNRWGQLGAGHLTLHVRDTQNLLKVPATKSECALLLACEPVSGGMLILLMLLQGQDHSLAGRKVS